jgi:dipeptide/tripeptide permease
VLPALRYLDLLLVVIALPVFVAAGLPLAGWGAAAGAWTAQRGLQVYLERRAGASKDPRTVVGLLAGSMIARGWFVAIVVLLIGLSDNEAGLAAAVMVIVLFTVYFNMRMILRPLTAEQARARGAAAPEATSLRPDGGAR